MSPPKEHARQTKNFVWRAAVVVIAVLSALETLAGAGIAVLIFGEILRLWDLL